MTEVKKAQGQSITLKGSSALVCEYFLYSINSILYQREIYPEETFTQRNRHGVRVLLSTDDKLNSYLSDVLKQVDVWLQQMVLHRLVLVVTSLSSGEVLERWNFDVHVDKDIVGTDGQAIVATTKDEIEIRKEMSAIIKQIVASVALLPLLNEPCSFDLLIYTDQSVNIPNAWGETGPKMINDAGVVKLRSFSTQIHKVSASVAYKKVD